MALNPEQLKQALLEAFTQSDRGGIGRIFEGYANAGLKNALLFLEADQPVYDLAALDCMATSFVHGGRPDEGWGFAGACVEMAKAAWKAGLSLPEKDLHYYLGNCTYLIQKLLLDTGRYAMAIDLYESQTAQRLPGWSGPLYAATHLQAAENYFENNQIERARQLIERIDRQTVPPASIVLYDRLLFKIKNLTAGVYQSSEDIAGFKKAQQIKDMQAMIKALKEVMKGYEADIDLTSLEKLAQVVEEGGPDADHQLLELARKISATTLEAQRRLSGLNNADNLQYKRHELGEIIYFLQDDVLSKKRENLENALLSLSPLMEWFKQQGHYSDVAFTAWNIYTCHYLLEAYDDAANALDIILFYLEKQRQSIPDIQKRAGVFKQYPHLFGCMAFCNYVSGNASRLFHCIEAAKARNLTDRALLQTGPTEGAASPETGYDGRLKELLVPVLDANRAHYLTLLVDDDRTYSVLLTRQGRIFASAGSPGRSTLSVWQQKDYASPETWRAPRSGLFGKKTAPDIPLELGAYIKPVALALEEGLVKEDDHIIYSPDGLLNIFPLQMAKLDTGHYLIEKLSVSKIHGGHQLLHLLKQPPAAKSGVFTIACPAKQDDVEKSAAFFMIEKFLQEQVAATPLPAVAKDWLGGITPNGHYHLATHGVFPQASTDTDFRRQNPYYNSGLLLKNGTLLPELQSDGKYYQSPHLLSPADLIDSKINLRGCHISMQACVSGRSREGYGGDALGLEWAFFYAGVKSMVSACWNIDVHWSNKIFERLYVCWYKQGKNLAEAHRSALIEALADAPSADRLRPPEYFWAGLTLTGDFR